MTLPIMQRRPHDDDVNLMFAAIRILLPIAKADYAQMLGEQRYPSMSHPARKRVDQLAEGIALAEEALRFLEPPI